jgi:thiamine pyrophosphate-dependent acetolactate synthase large subunit-like protein
MIRKEAVEIVSKYVGKNPVIAANGFISRDLFEIYDKKSNFYMIGSMGLASSIGLGVAIKNPKKLVYVFDGDGNILMNLGSLVTIGSLRPKNLIHIVFDNHSHESTGGQPTNSAEICLEKFAKITNYRIFKIKTAIRLNSVLSQINNFSGPTFILIKISKSTEKSKRVSWTPKAIRDRFTKSLG